MLEQLSSQSSENSRSLCEAYGKYAYKCPIIRCNRFHGGFDSKKLRDDHWRKAHERAHKCSIEGCDYLVIGFPTKADLTRHEELCHSEPHEEFMFPSVTRAPTIKTLKDAIDRDDASDIRDILLEITLNSIDDPGLLFRAVKHRSYSAAMVLLELLGETDQLQHKAKKGGTVLHEAVRTAQLDFLRTLTDTSIDVNAEDGYGRTPLLVALAHENFDAARLLLDHIDIIVKPVSERCMTYFRAGFVKASSGGHNDIVALTCKAMVAYFGREKHPLGGHNGAFPQLLRRALTSAASNNHESTYNLILAIVQEEDLERYYTKSLKTSLLKGMTAMKRPEKPEVDERGRTRGFVLARAAAKDNVATVSRLLDQGADVNAQGGVYGGALQAASYGDHNQMVQILLDKGADVNAEGNHRYRSAIWAASSKGHHQVVQILLDNGADVNTRDEYDRTGLYSASLEGHLQVVEILLDNGADINAQGGRYKNALRAAEYKVHGQVVQLLLDRGADVDA